MLVMSNSVDVAKPVFGTFPWYSDVVSHGAALSMRAGLS